MLSTKKHRLQDCDAVILACNTAHIIAPELEKKTHVPLKSLIFTTKQTVASLGFTKVGLVASPTSIKLGLFETENTQLILPNVHQLTQLASMIHGVISGKPPNLYTPELEEIITALFKQGAQSVVVGCTELELIMAKSNVERLIRPLELTIAKIFKAKQ